MGGSPSIPQNHRRVEGRDFQRSPIAGEVKRYQKGLISDTHCITWTTRIVGESVSSKGNNAMCVFPAVDLGCFVRL
jgi:hypothetical protein